MQQILDEFKSIPGIVGASVFRPKQGVLCHNLPALFKADRINEMGKHLVKIYAAGRHNFPDLAEVMVNYEEATILCRQFQGGDFLVAVCDPGANFNLLTMSMNLALEDFHGTVPASASAPPSAVPIAADKKPSIVASPMVPKVDLTALRESESLAAPLQIMQQALTKIMGPMAMIVFDEVVTIWATGGTPSTSNLNTLLELLCDEIGDPGKADRYRDMVKKQWSPE
jgi:predicted regulator of Ras-like GTPase activity (Roadblock/LC7/MglB family)